MRNRNNKGYERKLDPTGWMVTFGDLLMLLLTFFVMLMSMSSMDKQALKSVLGSFSGSLGQSACLDGMEAANGLMTKGGTGPMGLSDSQLVKVLTDRTDKVVAQKEEGVHVTSRRMLEEFFVSPDVDRDERREGLESMIDISEDERGVIITFSESLLFRPGEAEIDPTMFTILDSIAKVLGAVSNEVLIMGHSDNVPIRRGLYRSNWDLSLYRALNVHNYFVEKKGLSPGRFGVGGYGDIRPTSADNTKEAREKNRRVEIILKRGKRA